MYSEILKEICAFYAKYATSEGISKIEARKIIDDFDIIPFQKKAKEYVENKDFSEKANKELKKFNTKMYVSREKMLKQQLDLIVVSSGAKIEKGIKDGLVKAIDREVERQSGILGADLKLNDKNIKAIVNSNFGGVNWSNRLWDDMDDVRSEVERITTNVITRGRHPYEYVSEFKKKTNATTHNAKRLLITETARVQTEAQKLSYLDTLGTDGEYKFVAKMDEKTSKVCRNHNNHKYKVKDMVPGVNAPPMHPFCRSTTIPVVGDWREKIFAERKGKYSLGKYKSNYKDEDDIPKVKQSGALDDVNDVDGHRREKHATKYYESVRRRNKVAEIEAIARNTGLNKNKISRVYEHIFINKYALEGGLKRFDPDYEMAVSWQRLRNGKNILEKDIILLKHEALEHYLMKKYNMNYKKAHNIVQQKYNYSALT